MPMRFKLLVCLIIGVSLSCLAGGCARVVNKPIMSFPEPEIKVPEYPLAIAIRTSFENGSNSMHFRRADRISEELADMLQTAGQDRIDFFPLRTFDTLSSKSYDYLLDLVCTRPEHETRRNKPLLLLGWPATLSVIAAPLGVMVLSMPGIVQETATFEWQIRIAANGFESETLNEKRLKPVQSVVSSTAWGTKNELLMKSYENADSHLKNAAIRFVNRLDWHALDSKARAYAESKRQQPYAAVSDRRDFPESSPASPGIDKRFAVIVGVSNYLYSSDQGFANLKYADDDAVSMYNLMKQQGWSESQMKLLVNEDATKRNITIALESWLTMANTDDVILVFWAGHAFPDPQDPERVYFACYDTDIRIPATGYRMDYLRNVIEERRARNVVMIADTCHAGKLITRGNRGVGVVPYLEKLKKENNFPSGWIFMVSAESDREAIEGISWRNGAFTHCLLEGLKGKADGYERAGEKDHQITMGEIRAYMNSVMPTETLQAIGVAKHPVITTSTGDPTIWNMPFISGEY